MESQAYILLDVIIASFLAGLVGVERERTNKPAGVRTNMIVGGAVALFVSLGEVIVVHFAGLTLDSNINADPTRIIHAVIVGISFIGAGTILQLNDKAKIRFLTTAATILISTGIGIAVALNQYYLAAGVTVFILFVNKIVVYVDHKINRKEEKDEQ